VARSTHSTALISLVFIAMLAGPAAPPSQASPNRQIDSLRTVVDSGDLARAEAMARRLLVASERAAPPDSLQMGLVLDELAVVLRRTGRERTREAEEVCERALAIKAATVGVDHESYAASLNTLGTLYFYRKEFERAKPPLTPAFNI
jgi:tetratricopeptide (TPR) repeat protein